MNSSCMEEPAPVISDVLADSKSGSPEKAETRIFPAGTLKEKNPSSSAWVLPMGIQYVLESLSTTCPSTSISSPLNASLSIRILALGTGPIPSRDTVPSRVAPL